MSQKPRGHDPDPQPQSDEERLADSPAGSIEPLDGMGTAAGGGHGSGSDRSSGGSGEGENAAGADDQTDLLRQARGGSGSHVASRGINR
jgi:hypothetical protein